MYPVTIKMIQIYQKYINQELYLENRFRRGNFKIRSTERRSEERRRG